MTRTGVICSERGQMLVMIALIIPVLVVFAGLAIDGGLLYATKAKLQKSVDAACMDTMMNLAGGQSSAATYGTQIFDANFGSNPPVPSITFPIDPSGALVVKVTATLNYPTVFMKYVPGFANIPITATAQASRGRLAMSIVLDRSGSMDNSHDRGGAALQYAVPAFISYFNDTLDEVGMVSFASSSSIDFPIGYTFKTAITNKVKALSFVGGTFGTGIGDNPSQSSTVGPPLWMAQQQVDSIVPLPGENLVKVVVYFTDGLMNTVQDKFNCPSAKVINYGGYDVSSGDQSTTPDFFDISNGTDWGTVSTSSGSRGAFPYDSNRDYCKNSSGQYITTFYSQYYKAQKSFIQSTVTAEAKYRALQTATAMRSEDKPVFIYVIGLGSGVSSDTQAFLAQIANDPAYATYNASQPAGMFLYVPDCPSATCTSELTVAFQAIAAKVMLRLTG